MKPPWDRSIAVWLPVLGSAAVFLAATLSRFDEIVLDDSYMFIRYARHFLSGQGFCWNTGDGPAFGCTSTLHLLLVTLFRGLTQASDGLCLATISYAFGVAACAVLCLAGFMALPRESEDRTMGLPLLAIPPLLLSDTFGFHSLTGMETTLALFTNACLGLAALLLARRPGAWSMTGCLIAGYLTFLARPDNGLYALALPPLLMIATNRRRIRTALLYIACLCAMLGADLIVKKMLFDAVVPLPFFAKQSGYLEGYLSAANWNHAEMLMEFATAALPFGIMIVLTANRRSLPELLALAAPAAGTFLYFSTVVQIMGFHARFYYPSMAFVVLAAFVSAADRNRAPTAGNGHLAARLACLLVMIVPLSSAQFHDLASAAWRAHIGPKPIRFEAKTRYETDDRLPLPPLKYKTGILAVEEMLSMSPRGSSVACSEYGRLGAACPDTTILDLVGLHDPILARKGFSAERIVERRPDIVWFPTPDYTRIVAGLADNPTFKKEYDYYPDVFGYGLALWRLSPRREGIRHAFTSVFADTYPGVNPEARLGRVGN